MQSRVGFYEDGGVPEEFELIVIGRLVGSIGPGHDSAVNIIHHSVVSVESTDPFEVRPLVSQKGQMSRGFRRGQKWSGDL